MDDAALGATLHEPGQRHEQLDLEVIRDLALIGLTRDLGELVPAVQALGDVTTDLTPFETTRRVRVVVGERVGRRAPHRGSTELDLDRAALVELLVGLGRLAVDRPDVASVDVNPLIVTANGAYAADALIRIRDTT